MSLYTAKGENFTNKVRENLLDKKRKILYIQKKDKGVYKQYIEENLSNILEDPGIPGEHKAELAHLSISTIAQTLFEKPVAQTISRYKSAISSVMDYSN